MKKKIIVIVAVLAFMLCFVIAGTLAWLTDKTDEVKNTFTYGNIDITLVETTGEEYKMVPGNTIEKDPAVTVKGSSEACWLFIKVNESDNLGGFISYTVASEWTPLDGVAGVYYREVEASAEDQKFNVLADNKVMVKDTVTKTEMDALEKGTIPAPTLTFTAYAVQRAHFETAADAWAEAVK